MDQVLDFRVRIATSDTDLRAAQRLRYDVFVSELGGDGAGVDHAMRIEADQFDPHCAHLVLVDNARSEAALDHVVGVYRLMQFDGAQAAGAFYSSQEFDLTPLLSCNKKLLELGRSCLHPDYRGGGAMYYLWQGLADYVAQNNVDVLFGVASFHGTDMAELAHPLAYLHHNHLAPAPLRARALPEHFVDMASLTEDQVDRRAALRAIPALIKAYLRLGGGVGQGAYVDHAFNTTDVFMVMDTADITARHRRIYGARG